MTIQITEIKPKGALSTTLSDYFALQTNSFSTANTPAPVPSVPITPSGGLVTAQTEEETPSRRREPRRKGSLVLYDDNLPQQRTQETSEKTERRNSLSMLRGKMESSQIYEPPTFDFLNQDTDVPPPVVRDRLVVEDFPKHSISTAWIKMVKQGLSEWLRMPVIVCRGTEDGPVVGITAAVHGNELNGVPCIHR